MKALGASALTFLPAQGAVALASPLRLGDGAPGVGGHRGGPVLGVLGGPDAGLGGRAVRVAPIEEVPACHEPGDDQDHGDGSKGVDRHGGHHHERGQEDDAGDERDPGGAHGST